MYRKGGIIEGSAALVKALGTSRGTGVASYEKLDIHLALVSAFSL
jgi:hypothetical protein